MIRRSRIVRNVGSGGGGNYTLDDFRRITESGQRTTPILKIDHPFRQQRLMIVPIPPFAKEEFFKDWCYQPYSKDNTVLINADIYHPMHTLIPQLMLGRGKWEGYDFYRPTRMPDNVDMDLTRQEYFRKFRNLGKGKHWFAVMTLPQRIIWRRHPWMKKYIQTEVGTKYLTHPDEDHRNYVIMCSEAYGPTVLNGLKELGFRVQERMDIEIGDPKVLDEMNFHGDNGDSFYFAWIYAMVFSVILGFYEVLKKEYYIYIREQIIREGHDPKEFGY